MAILKDDLVLGIQRKVGGQATAFAGHKGHTFPEQVAAETLQGQDGVEEVMVEKGSSGLLGGVVLDGFI